MNTRRRRERREPPRLILCAPTWGMVGYPSPRQEWSLERKLSAMKAEGLDGVRGWINPEIQRIASRLGLAMMSGFDCSSLASVRPRLVEQKALGVRFINIQLLDHDTNPERAAAMAVGLTKALPQTRPCRAHRGAPRHGDRNAREVHRDCAALQEGDR